MNKAEELRVKQKLVELLNKPIENLLQQSWLVTKVYDLFEIEFKSRVNAISDDIIEKKFCYYGSAYFDWSKGAKWFKNKLLKQ